MTTVETNLRQVLTNHRVTREIAEKGLRKEHLAGFRLKINDDLPYTEWPIWGGRILLPADTRVFRLVRIYCTLKWLQTDPPSSRNRNDAYDAVALFEAEPDLIAGRRHRAAQETRAKRPRDTLDQEGTTLRQIFAKLVREHPDEMPSEIWPHFISELRFCHLDPAERTSGGKKVEKYVQYMNRSEAGKPRTLTFRSFSAKLRKARTEASRKA